MQQIVLREEPAKAFVVRVEVLWIDARNGFKETSRRRNNVWHHDRLIYTSRAACGNVLRCRRCEIIDVRGFVRRVSVELRASAGTAGTINGTIPIRMIQIASEIRIAAAVSRRQKKTRKTTAPKKMLKVISVFISEATP